MVEKEETKKEKVSGNELRADLSVRSYNCLKRARYKYCRGFGTNKTERRHDEGKKSGEKITGRRYSRSFHALGIVTCAK